MPKGLCLGSTILWALECAQGPVTKSLLLKILSGLAYSGYIEASFVSYSERLRTAFDKLLEEGFISYTKGKPVKITYLDACSQAE